MSSCSWPPCTCSLSASWACGCVMCLGRITWFPFRGSAASVLLLLLLGSSSCQVSGVSQDSVWEKKPCNKGFSIGLKTLHAMGEAEEVRFGEVRRSEESHKQDG